MADRRRLLLKISGEALGAQNGGGIGSDELHRIAREVSGAMRRGDRSLALVVGGGNFLRGRELIARGIGRVTADHMGMLATVMNGLALQSALESQGLETRVLSAISIEGVVESFSRRRAVYHLGRGRILIFVGGTGHPFFSTDTTAALRALEIEAHLLLKGTRVRGVYSEDPRKNPDARYYEEITFDEVLQKDLEVMDATAISLCRDHDLPIEVFDMTGEGNIERAILGDRLGTLVRN